MTNILQSIRKLKASIAVLVGDDKKIIKMIKDEYLKESTIPDDQDLVNRKKKFRGSYFNFADFDERKMLRALRLGLYFR